MTIDLNKQNIKLRGGKRHAFYTVTLITLLTMALFAAFMQSAYAVNQVTTAALSVYPNPAQINTNVLAIFWLEPYTPSNTLFYHNLTVTVTAPDGTTQTLGPFTSNLNAGAYCNFVATQLGNYSLKFNYPGEIFSNGDYYMPSQTPVTTLVVQKQPTPSYPEVALPTDYWSRPINAENRNWYAISGNWLMGGYNISGRSYESGTGFNPYTTAPVSAHVVWVNPFDMGGLVGGSVYGAGSPGSSYYAGLPYQTRVTPPIIINGVLYYRLFQSGSGSKGNYPGFVAVDLRTGKELWRNTTGSIDAGQTWNYLSPNQYGAFAYLWDTSGATWSMYDAWSGTLLLTFANATAPTATAISYGDDGTLFTYTYNGQMKSPWLLMWNSTKAFEGNGLITLTNPGITQFRPRPGTFDWTKGIQYNVTEPNLSAACSLGNSMSPDGGSGVLVAISGSSGTINQLHVGYSMADGTQLWAVNRTIPGVGSRRAFGDGIYAVADTVTGSWIAYNIYNGQQLWTSDPQVYPWGTYTSYYATIAYGTFYGLGYDGYVHAWNITNGKEIWKFYGGDDIYNEVQYGHYPFFNGPIVADGVVYVGTGEHSPMTPLSRGETFFALDAYSGKQLWNISGWIDPKAIADGYLVTTNAYDNQIYTFGKGLSATTTTASPKVSVSGSTVLIEGTVTDQSPAQTCLGIPAAGTPAISDDSMSQWMEYLYMQQPKPTSATGVPVTISVFDPNNNTYTIGTTTSDANGDFGFAWTPPVPGLYKLTATFAGSNSYYSSNGETMFVVSKAASSAAAIVTPTPTPTTTSIATPTPSGIVTPTPTTPQGPGGIPASTMYAIAAAAIVIVIIAVAAIALRRRK